MSQVSSGRPEGFRWRPRLPEQVAKVAAIGGLWWMVVHVMTHGGKEPKPRCLAILDMHRSTRSNSVKSWSTSSQHDIGSARKGSRIRTEWIGTRKSTSRFALEDIDSMVDKKPAVKKESTAATVPKPHSPMTRKRSIAKKRKATSSSEGALFADADFEDAISMMQQGLEHLALCHNEVLKERAEAQKTIAELRKMMATKTTCLEDATKELNQLREDWGDLRASHASEIEDLLLQAKKDAALTIFQARIKIAEEPNDPSFDRSKWDVAKWKRMVAELEEEAGEDAGEGSGAAKGADGATVGKVVEAKIIGGDMGDEGCDEKA